MSDHREEMISVMLDGELERAEAENLIKEMGRNSACRDRFERYQLISDTLKKQLPDLLKHNLVLRINEAIAGEVPHSGNVRKISEPLPSAWRITGFALAASLAAMAVIGVQWHTPDAALQAPLAASTVSLPAAKVAELDGSLTLPGADSGVQLVSAGQSAAAVDPTVTPAADAPAQWKMLRAPNQSRLAEYLVNHNEYSSVVPVRDGLMPQVRVVGYDAAE